jgi:hypothetical protein
MGRGRIGEVDAARADGTAPTGTPNMSQERPVHMLQTTALVNEAYLGLIDVAQVS